MGRHDLKSTAMPRSGDDKRHVGGGRGGGPGYTRAPRPSVSRSSAYQGPSDLAFPGNKADARSTAGTQAKGSRTINARTQTPTSIQDVGKSTFGAGTKYCDTGRLDNGDGTGYGGKRSR